MRTLRFIVDGQNLKKAPDCDFTKLVRGSHGYLECRFSFSREWMDCKIAVSFFHLGKEVDAVLLEKDYCTIPDNIADLPDFSIKLTGVRGTYRITSCKLPIRQEG